MGQDPKTTILKQKQGKRKSKVQTLTEIPTSKNSPYPVQDSLSRVTTNVVKVKKGGAEVKYKRKTRDITPSPFSGGAQKKTKSTVTIKRK
jgi:hypothetical protein